MRSLAALLAAALALPAVADEEIAAGAAAPTFSLRTLNAEAAGTPWLSLDRLAGEAPEDAASRLVLVSFFASWCEPCRRELPLLVQLDREYRDRGLRVVGVSIDREEDGIAAATRLAAAAGARYPVCSDRFNFLARRYLGEQAPLPSVFLVRRDGTIARIERGYARDAAGFLVEAVRAELGLPPAAPAAGPAAPEPSAPAERPSRPAPRKKARRAVAAG